MKVLQKAVQGPLINLHFPEKKECNYQSHNAIHTVQSDID